MKKAITEDVKRKNESPVKNSDLAPTAIERTTNPTI
jgi:hypothetical protein